MPRFPVFAAALLLAALWAAPARAAVEIQIDKQAQRMTVSVDGLPRWTWPVSTGRAGHATPNGAFRAFRMEKDHYSKEWDDAPMPNSIFFTDKGHAIHGSFETKKLGQPASAGCVRLAPAHAEKLFELVKAQGVTSTKVVVTGAEPLVARRAAPPSAPREPMDLSAQQARRQTYPPPGYAYRRAEPAPYPYGQPSPYGQAHPQARSRYYEYEQPYYGQRYQRGLFPFGW